MTTKQIIRKKFLKPKKKLERERLASRGTIREYAKLLGINPDAYSSKEKGEYPFSDYEMTVIANHLSLPIEYLFFID